MPSKCLSIEIEIKYPERLGKIQMCVRTDLLMHGIVKQTNLPSAPDSAATVQSHSSCFLEAGLPIVILRFAVKALTTVPIALHSPLVADAGAVLAHGRRPHIEDSISYPLTYFLCSGWYFKIRVL